MDVRLDGIEHGVDTGLLVFDERTYPQLIALFKRLGVASAPADMSSSVQAPQAGSEWCGSNLNSVFALRARNRSGRPRYLASAIRH